MNPDPYLAFREIIVADEQLQRLTGNRVYTDQLPQTSAMPSIVLTIIGNEVHGSLEGNTNLDSATMRVVCLDHKRNDCNTLAWNVTRVLDGFSGVSASTCIDSIVKIMGITGGTEMPVDGSDRHRFISIQEFMVHYDSATYYEPSP